MFVFVLPILDIAVDSVPDEEEAVHHGALQRNLPLILVFGILGLLIAIQSLVAYVVYK